MSHTTPSLAYRWTFWRVVGATLALVGVGLGFWLLYRFHQVLFILFIAIVIGTALRPVVSWLRQRGVPGVAGVILVYLTLLCLLVGFILLLAPIIVAQGATITAALPSYYQNLRIWMINQPGSIMESLRLLLPEAPTLATLVEQTEGDIRDSVGQAAGYVGVASKVIFTAVVILLLAYYWTVDGPRVMKSLLRLLPRTQRETASELIATMETKMVAFIGGQGLLMLSVGLMCLVAYWIIGLPYLLVLAFVAALMEAIPIVGPLLGAVPAVLVALTIGPDKALWVIVATLIIQQLENSLLVPRIMRQSVGVNPFVTLLSLFAFSALLGIPGALLAIPMAAIIQILLNHFVFQPGALEPETPTGRDYASRLRQEAQALAQDLRQQARQETNGSDEQVEQTEQALVELEILAVDLDRLLAEALPEVGT
jgi:predicted PurR-regulated permease PerM